MSETIWLDCSLRDGGYYNNWDFSFEAIQHYLDAMAGLGADRVEIGLRTRSRTGFRGATAYTTNSFLESLSIPIGLKIGIMVNASEISGSRDETLIALKTLLPSESRKLIDFVRVATHLEEIEISAHAARWLKSEGYEVGINIMQISEAAESDFTKICHSLEPTDVDVLYVADSLGNLNPAQISAIISQLGDQWEGALGIHAHDNGGLALANTLAAMASGVRWVDSTVSGMGRGAGNTRTELLAGHLLGGGRIAPNASLLGKLIDDYFDPMQAEGGWGANFHYVRAAKLGIHPSFIQELLSNKSYSVLEINSAITALGAIDSKRYSADALENAQTWVREASSPRSGWEQTSMFQGADVLIIGAGPAAEAHRVAIEQFIKTWSPRVLVANLSPDWLGIDVDAHIACHPLRLAADGAELAAQGRKVIAPRQLLREEIALSLERQGLLCDVGIDSTAPALGADQGIAYLPNPLVLPFSLLVCLSGGARRIYLAGFDGYADGDSRLQVEQEMLDAIQALNFKGKIFAVTPTKFRVPLTSIYGLAESSA